MEARYLLFVGDQYYPIGGAKDLEGNYATLFEAWEALASSRAHDWAHILEVTDDEARIVWDSRTSS